MKKLAMSFALVAVAGMAGCSDDGVLSWEEFQRQVYHDSERDVFVVNGDETAQNLDELFEYYEAYLDTQDAVDGDGIGTNDAPLIVHQANGGDAKWDASTAQNLTYCIATGKGGFSASEYSAVVAAMNGATGDWEGTANVNFVHASNLDGSGCSKRTGVVFNVRRVNSGQYLASAFFPNYPRRSREVLIDGSSFGTITPYSLRGILRHELGHTLGFRHEHTRPESGTCFEDNQWRALTAYDSASVMHYPQCNGSNNGDLVLTSLDRSGARILYP